MGLAWILCPDLDSIPPLPSREYDTLHIAIRIQIVFVQTSMQIYVVGICFECALILYALRNCLVHPAPSRINVHAKPPPSVYYKSVRVGVGSPLNP